MNGLIAIYFCVINLFCSPVTSYIGPEGGEVTDAYPGVTQQVVDGYGTIFTAHVGKVGSWFYYVWPGDEIRVWYSDGSHLDFVVAENKWYEMVGQDMKNLETGQVLTVVQAYDLDAKYLTLQTCAESRAPVLMSSSGTAQFDAAWGRYIIVAVPTVYKGEKAAPHRE